MTQFLIKITRSCIRVPLTLLNCINTYASFRTYHLYWHWHLWSVTANFKVKKTFVLLCYWWRFLRSFRGFYLLECKNTNCMIIVCAIKQLTIFSNTCKIAEGSLSWVMLIGYAVTACDAYLSPPGCHSERCHDNRGNRWHHCDAMAAAIPHVYRSQRWTTEYYVHWPTRHVAFSASGIRPCSGDFPRSRRGNVTLTG